MTNEEIINYCMNKKGASIHFPFDEETLCIKVVGRIFAMVFSLKGRRKLSLKCVAEVGILLRAKYPNIVLRGYHCPPVQQPYNNTIDLGEFTSDEEIRMMIDHSYMTIIDKLSKKKRAEFEEKIDER